MKEKEWLTWEEQYSVFVDELDEQHRKILDLINILKRSQEVHREREAAKYALAEMQKYANAHFRSEEHYMEANHYPGLARHIEEHHFFIQKMTVLQEDVKLNRGNLDTKFLLFLKQWWINHILHVDHEYAVFIDREERKKFKSDEE